MTLTPVGARVVVELKEKETKSVSGIILSADKGEKEQQYGTIIALGKGKDSDENTPENLGLEIGQTILFGKYGGEEVEDKATGKKYKVLKLADIYAIVG